MGIQKDNLLKLNINYSSLNEMEYLSLGELGLVIAAHKFFDLSNLINNANFSIQQINKCNSEELKSYYLRYAILDYNACYDYLLQIIYFAFDFFPDFDYTSFEEYQNIIKNNCRLSCTKKVNGVLTKVDTEFAKDINKLKETNIEFKRFYKKFNKYNAFASDKKFGIRQWVNNIKHQGGFYFNEVLKHIGYTECMDYSGNLLFTTKILMPFAPTFDNAINRLYKQNLNIVEYSQWLFEYLFKDTTHIDFMHKPKVFSANKNHFKELKFHLVYATE
ncbi:hypothetical protein [Xylanibacter rarus]|jgi:hypothetical protein|uniref:hypothetical protein n=1 Tax=Xylanibacter rarus TaxID=1676614 RepID=UPI003AB989C1